LEEGIIIARGLGGNNLLGRRTHIEQVFGKAKNRASSF
jgi:hypothetical protein